MAESGDFNFSEREAIKARERGREIADDLTNERAGRETGRMKRLPEAFHEAHNPKDKEKKDAKHLSNLMRLLQSDAAYRALYEKTLGMLRDAESAADKALEAAMLALKTSRAAYQDILDNAARMPGGTRVFRDQQGRIWTEHGVEVTGSAKDEIVWRGGEPGYEAFLDSGRAMESAQNRYQTLTHYRVNTLGDIRNRMEDQNDPVSKNDIQKIRKTLVNETPKIVQSNPEVNQNLQTEQQSASVKILNPDAF